MTQATVFPPPEQAENVLRKNCWRVSTHSSWFLTFSSSLSVSPASSSRSQRKKLVGIIWYLHLSPDHPNPSPSARGSWVSFLQPDHAVCAGLQSSQYTHCSLFLLTHLLPTISAPQHIKNTRAIKTGSRNRAVSNSRDEIASCDPHGRPVLQSCSGERTVRIPARPPARTSCRPAPAAAKILQAGFASVPRSARPRPEALQRFRFAILRHRFAPTAASCTGSDLQILNERNLHTKPSNGTKTIKY